ncbi:putative CyaY, involved in iron scavenging and/or transfer to heme [Moritella sp. PE36]|uniref:iron donor protein CyaY n=1 Tax=Moritella sp. PE36 TaxID=58051 RepID=UPI00015683E3|nr:iron donor protein CyaY [Moritella sp. PE36]EDM68277.1 putative CyaY, involved in iron scavenging and/or transfer to heme [Moritella sp. PE36]
MTDSEFHQQVDELLISFEEIIDDSDVELDYENSNSILTLYCRDGSQIILNKQTPLHQIWVATKANGHHFALINDVWVDNRTQQVLSAVLTEAVKNQGGENVSF